MKLIITLLCTVAALISPVMSSADELGAKQDETGFTYYLKDAAFGSKSTLIFQKRGYQGRMERFGVEKEYIDDNVAALNKFLKWATKAKEQGDTVNKEIALVLGFEFGIVNFWNKYDFKTEGHYYALSITPGNKVLFQFMPAAVDDPKNSQNSYVMYFNESQASNIIKLLMAFKEDKIKNVQDSDYQ